MFTRLIFLFLQTSAVTIIPSNLPSIIVLPSLFPGEFLSTASFALPNSVKKECNTNFQTRPRLLDLLHSDSLFFVLFLSHFKQIFGLLVKGSRTNSRLIRLATFKFSFYISIFMCLLLKQGTVSELYVFF